MTSKENSALSLKEVLEIVKQDVKKRDFEILDYEIKSASDKPMGFLGEHMKLKVNVAVSGRRKKALHYFLKRTPTEMPSHRRYLEQIGCFYKEIGLYKTAFEDFQLKNGKNEIKWHPRYYYSKNDDLFVVEDLSVSGYRMFPERTLMDEEHVLATLKSLAVMHSSSIVFEEKLNEEKIDGFNFKEKFTVGEIYSRLLFETEATEDEEHPGNAVHEMAIQSQLPVVDFLDGYTAREKEMIKEKLPDRMRRFFQLVKPSEKFKNVIVHGDLWANNILFKKSEAGNVQNAVIIDFQLARCAPPAHDVVTFLHLVQNGEFRGKFRSKTLKHYYDAFSNHLEANGLNATKVLPFDEFLESCDFYEELGILMSIFYFQLILTPPEICDKYFGTPEDFCNNVLVDRSEVIKESFLTNAFYKARVSEAMNELIQKFILV